MVVLTFREASSACFDECSLDGERIAALPQPVLRSWTATQRMPDLPEPAARMVLCALALAAPSPSLSSSDALWASLSASARGLLLLAVRREGCVSAGSAQALNLLNKPQVVGKYAPLAPPHAHTLRRARDALGGGDAPVDEWLGALGALLEEPPRATRWYASPPAAAAVALAAGFVLLHTLVLLRALQHVHAADRTLLLLPLLGLGASAAVGGIAIGVNKLSEAPRRKRI
ncbi:hypothetical protein AB1Y20_013375 [Prymnesium parvum]|uniref:Uncharacterized protein n=1 Tax=Prymnesium parvum TaxID=97485 RepID=A0AB34IF57_PRYPA